MKNPLAFTALLAFAGAAVCGAGFWYQNSTRKAQVRVISQAQSKFAVSREMAEKAEGEWSETRLRQAKARADEFAKMRISRAAWDEIVQGAGANGIRIETTEVRAAEGAGSRLRAVLQFAGLPASERNLVAITDLLEKLDRTVGGCQRLQLSLGQLNAQTRLPGPIFADGSLAVYEFSLASANPENPS